MSYYIGLEVSLKEMFVSGVDEQGYVVNETIVSSDAAAIAKYLQEQAFSYKQIGLKRGQLSISLSKQLRQQVLLVIGADARHMVAIIHRMLLERQIFCDTC